MPTIETIIIQSKEVTRQSTDIELLDLHRSRVLESMREHGAEVDESTLRLDEVTEDEIFDISYERDGGFSFSLKDRGLVALRYTAQAQRAADESS